MRQGRKNSPPFGPAPAVKGRLSRIWLATSVARRKV
jgi:hypothetical protein